MRRLPLLFILGASLLAGRPALAEAPVLIKDLEIEVRPGRRVRGAVLIEDGLIRAVGAVEAPAGARVIDGAGLVAYAGFIDAWSDLGFGERKTTEEGRKAREGEPQDLEDSAPITMPEARRKGLHAAYVAADGFEPKAEELARHRAAGFTAAGVAPRFGYIAGWNSVVQLGDDPLRDAVISRRVHLQASFSSGGAPGYPSTAMGVMAHLRQYLADAQRHAIWRKLYRDRAPGVPRPAMDRGLQTMELALSGRRRVVFAARRENEIRRALALADEFKLSLALAGGQEAWRLADELAARKTLVFAGLDWPDKPKAPKWMQKKKEKKEKKPGIKGPFAFSFLGALDFFDDQEPSAAAKDVLARLEMSRREYDERLRLWKEQVKNVVLLDKKGLTLALGTRGLKKPGDFLPRLRQLIKEGLPRDKALAAITTDAAAMLGQRRSLGVVAAGRIANLTILTGDFADKESRVRYTVIDGRVYEHEVKEAKKQAQKGGKAGAKKRPAKRAAGLDLSGAWTVTIADSLEAELDLTQSGDEVRGTLTSPYGVARLKGTLKGDALRFEANGVSNGREYSLEVKGTVAGDTLSGTLDSPLGQGMKWVARRKDGRASAALREAGGALGLHVLGPYADGHRHTERCLDHGLGRKDR